MFNAHDCSTRICDQNLIGTDILQTAALHRQGTTSVQRPVEAAAKNVGKKSGRSSKYGRRFCWHCIIHGYLDDYVIARFGGIYSRCEKILLTVHESRRLG